MKVNLLLTDIFQGLWAVSPHSLEALRPIVAKILEGEAVFDDKTSASILDVETGEGRFLAKDKYGAIAEEVPPGSVASIYMTGPVVKYGGMCNYGADDIVGALRFANNNPNIKGIVFHIDGPGGAVNALGPFLEFAEEKKKPVVAVVDAAYSMHYWVAVTVADRILAHNKVTSGVGSVGVVLSFVDSRPVFEEKGYKFHNIYPDESSHKNEAFMLALEGKYEMIKTEMLSPKAKLFQEAVRAGRPNLKEEEGVLTGKTFGAERALELGMIDGIGGAKAARQLIDILSELKNFQ